MSTFKDQVAPRKVGADKTFTVEAPPGVKVEFRPGAENRGGWPIRVMRKGDQQGRFAEVEGPGAFRMPEGMGTIIIDTTPGGGVEGDEWHLQFLETEVDGFEQRQAFTKMGALKTTRAGGHVLFSFDSAKHIGAFVDAQALNAHNLWINPDQPDRFSPSPGAAWDLSAFNELVVMVTVGTNSPPSPSDDGTLYMLMDGFTESMWPQWANAQSMASGGAYNGAPMCVSQTSGGILRNIYDGTWNRIGFWLGSKAASGSATPKDDGSITHYAMCPPRGRFRLSADANFTMSGQPINLLNSGTAQPGQLLITAVAF